MLEMFKPTWMVERAYEISPAALKRQGIRAVFSDLDNTLIAWNNPNGRLNCGPGWRNCIRQEFH